MNIVEMDKRLVELLAEALRICNRQDHQTLLRVVQEETQDEIDRFERPLRVVRGGKYSPA